MKVTLLIVLVLIFNFNLRKFSKEQYPLAHDKPGAGGALIPVGSWALQNSFKKAVEAGGGTPWSG